MEKFILMMGEIFEIDPSSIALEDNFKQKIINECNTKLNLNLCEDNIVLHDIKNDKIIKTIKDIHDNNTKICKIIIILTVAWSIIIVYKVQFIKSIKVGIFYLINFS